MPVINDCRSGSPFQIGREVNHDVCAAEAAEREESMQTKNYKFWFCTGSQDLYGDECLKKVAEHSAKIVEGLNASGKLPFEVVCKPTLISQASIRKTFNDANNDEDCAGVITWMHTFPRRRCGYSA